MKKVLIVCPIFPPVLSSGTIRIAKFAKYLPEFDWQPILLTEKNSFSLIYDEQLLKDLPDSVRIFQSWSLNIRRRFVRKKRWIDSQAEGSPKRPSILNWLKNTSYRFIKTLMIPDYYIDWAPFAFLKGLSVLRKESPQIIFASYYPGTALLVAYFLSLVGGKKLVVEFRDPWVGNKIVKNIHQDRFRNWISSFFEKIIIRRAAFCIFVTEVMRQNYQKKYSLSENQTQTIENGYDESDFPVHPINRPENGKINLLYSGSFYGTRNPRKFFEALKIVLDNKKELKDQVLVDFIGDFDSGSEPTNQLAVNQLGLAENVCWRGRVPYQESIHSLCTSDALLLITHEEESDDVIPAKVYEYLRAQKPILGITCDQETVRLLKDSGMAFIADPRNVYEITDKVEKVIQAVVHKNIFTPNLGFIRSLNRRDKTSQLAIVFNRILDVHE